MKLTLDNFDGLGALDYSSRICADAMLTLERRLNTTSRCSWSLDLTGTTLATPARRARVSLESDEGTVLFTGYVVTEPEMVFAGEGTEGAAYRAQVTALSDEWLLDRQGMPLIGAGLAQRSGVLLETMTSRVDGSNFVTMGAVDTRVVGVFDSKQTQSWSENAGELADAAYSAYRVVNGVVSLQTAGAVVHAFNDGDGSLQVSALQVSQARELANDVTLSGELEEAAYVTEIFEGDGATSQFRLTSTPFRAPGSSTQPVLMDSFDKGSFDPRIWILTDPGSHLGFSGGGFKMTGGNGLDGATTLVAFDPLEIGGTLVLEAGNVVLQAPSDGVLCGVYGGAVSRSGCFTGYNVRPSSGSTIVAPLVNGVEVGTPYTIQSGHTYALRIRLHCIETQRVLQVYYAMSKGIVQQFGGGLIDAPLRVVFELQDLGLAADTPAKVLYDGSLQGSPAVCTFAAANSVQLVGSMGFCRIRQTGSTWVTSTLANGTTMTRLMGVAGEGVDCTFSAADLITFLAGRIPQPGERVMVEYRQRQRSIARLADQAGVTTEAIWGLPGTSRWLGRVIQPIARSSVDCENAAAAVLSFSANRDAALAGRYVTWNPVDIWPGDVLLLTTQSRSTYVVVRGTTIRAMPSYPAVLIYEVQFANDWAEALGVKLSEAIATDVLLPNVAADGPSQTLTNLQQLEAVSVTGLTLQVDTGVAPPAGGGFEVRRRDNDFGPAVDQDLVLRSPVRNFTIPREAQLERYFVRMYDGSTPPLYSRFSSAIFTNVPVS